LIPAGLDVTVPEPRPVSLTVKVNCGGGFRVSVAALLVVLPAELLTTTVNWAGSTACVVVCPVANTQF